MNNVCKISHSNIFAKNCKANIKKIYCTFDMVTIEKNEDFASYSGI
jgi:hypothetical protein